MSIINCFDFDFYFCVHSVLLGMTVYHLLGWLWVMNFIIALGLAVLAGSFASYYWAWDKKTVSVLNTSTNYQFTSINEFIV